MQSVIHCTIAEDEGTALLALNFDSNIGKITSEKNKEINGRGMALHSTSVVYRNSKTAHKVGHCYM